MANLGPSIGNARAFLISDNTTAASCGSQRFTAASALQPLPASVAVSVGITRIPIDNDLLCVVAQTGSGLAGAVE
jgi:hypothetical protein